MHKLVKCPQVNEKGPTLEGNQILEDATTPCQRQPPALGAAGAGGPHSALGYCWEQRQCQIAAGVHDLSIKQREAVWGEPATADCAGVNSSSMGSIWASYYAKSLASLLSSTPGLMIFETH